ncbi:MAG: carboxypeptidase regulatory-like domain-containing protein [Vicinamibacterales bacterium]
MAQTNSAIAGVVVDQSGAVLPGVTVEASSESLIERVRTAVTGESGQYRLVELRPGVYTVTFTQPGFSVVRREGVELTTNFTATVNAALKVGDLQETVTVSGSSPVVDTQNVVQQRVMTREVIDAVPTARTFANLGVLIPGTTVTGYGRTLDVGGSEGHDNQMLMVHGGRAGDQRVLLEGMGIGMMDVSGAFPTLAYPDGSVEELNMGLGAHVAEMETGGVRVNIIPKSGSNRYSGTLLGSFTNDKLQSTNLDDNLRSRGLTAVDRVNYISDINPAFGGPLLQDKLWFYLGVRDNRTLGYSTLRRDTNPRDWVYTPDLSRRPGENDQKAKNGTARLTWQASTKDKIGVNFVYEDRCRCEHAMGGTFEPSTAPEADLVHRYLSTVGQVTWVRPATNKLLFEAGVSAAPYRFHATPSQDAVGPAALELATGFSFRARSAAVGLNEAYYLSRAQNNEMRGSVSYVTGAHAFKVGIGVNPGSVRFQRDTLGDYLVVLLNGVPNRAEFFATPYHHRDTMTKVALYAQDQWTVNKLTLNLGVRFDRHKSGYDAVDLPATNLLPARQFDGADVLNWKDVSPRLGAAYDVFGNGRTAIKATWSRYVAAETIATARSLSPTVTSTARLARAWVDANGDFIPQGDPTNPLPNGELVGPSPNANWGQPVITLRQDPRLIEGWGVRSYNWEFSGGVQHEFIPRMSVSAMFFRRSYGNFAVIDNLAVAPTDYDPFCITGPTDSRLPGGGGTRICGLYDLAPVKVGQLDRVRTLASDYGTQTEVWQGVDVNVDARLPNGILLQGGVSTGRTATDNCDVVGKIDNPSPLYCQVALPYLANVKLLGSYMLPAQIQVAATFQSIPGNPISAFYVARNTDIAPSLGRNLSSGINGTVAVNVVDPGAMLTDRVNQLDFRAARSFRRGPANLKVMVDLYNALNANPVTALNNTFGTTGATWLQPLQILASRVVRFSAQLNF